jgi:RNA polymerase sigma-70 factor (sigma-E family)
MSAEPSIVEREPTVDEGRGVLSELYARYVPAATRLAFLLTGDRQQAEDLAQEAFVRCTGRFAHLRAQAAFDAYLRRAMINLHTSALRRRRLEREWVRREGGTIARRTTAMPDVAGREDLWRALATLPARQRAALVLRYYEDLSETDAALALGCSPAALKSLVTRGSARLRDLISEGEDR